MAREHADMLQEILEGGKDKWPLPQEEAIVRKVREWAAFANTDEEALQQFCGWQRSEHQHMEYVPDPLPERIKEAFADLIVGTEPGFESPGGDNDVDPPDQDLLDDLVEENDLPSELWGAVAQMVAEGEVWYRIYVDNELHEHPVIEFHSRADVVPLYRGRKVLAVAFISDIDDLAPDAPVLRVGDASDPVGTRMWREQGAEGEKREVVFRYVEIQTGGYIRNLLYQGTPSSLGTEVPLNTLDELADLREEWQHDIEASTGKGSDESRPVMLAGRITNGRAGRLGRSQYTGVRKQLYDLNKNQSIGSRNVDLTIQKRAVLPGELVQKMLASGSSRVDLPDAFMMPRDAMGEQQPMGVMEFSTDWATALLEWDGGLVDKILTRTRVAPQLVGRHTEDAQTGPALRARLLDSVLAADGKALKVDDEVPKMLQKMQLLSALPKESGGSGHGWAKPDEPPIFSRSSILPEDENEEAIRHAGLVGARIEARQTAIEDLHEEWDADRVQEELDRIDADPPPGGEPPVLDEGLPEDAGAPAAAAPGAPVAAPPAVAPPASAARAA